jgi:pimeloyl-ACP methyl ester carboxylesterase
MPYCDSEGVRIHYQVEGDGPSMVLQHGFTQNLEHWREFGYVDAFRERYRLILIDARGHGLSDKPHDRAAYAWPIPVQDVVAVLDDAGIDAAIYWGYSRGGSIGFGLAQRAPERVRALVVGGAFASPQPIGTALRHVDGSDPEAFVAAFESIIGARIVPEYRTRLLAADTRALAAAAQDRPSMEQSLPRMTMPSLLYAGDRDPFFPKAKATASRMPNAVFLPLPGLGHAEGFRRSDLVAPPLKDFFAMHKM